MKVPNFHSTFYSIATVNVSVVPTSTTCADTVRFQLPNRRYRLPRYQSPPSPIIVMQPERFKNVSYRKLGMEIVTKFNRCSLMNVGNS